MSVKRGGPQSVLLTSLSLYSHLLPLWYVSFRSSNWRNDYTPQVEQETSVIGPKLIATVIAIAACLTYVLFRHWLANKMNGNIGRPSFIAKIGEATARYIDR